MVTGHGGDSSNGSGSGSGMQTRASAAYDV